MNDGEKIRITPERKSDRDALEQLGAERREQLHSRLEAERPTHENEAKARHEALETAVSSERDKKVEAHRQTVERAAAPPRRVQREASFNATMQEVQTQMSPSSRTFSKVIHNKSVEAVSDAAASTIARPNAILSGAIFAFVLTLGTFLVAKNLGYPLSGFETIGAFILGWVIGLVYDFLKVMITGRK